jgi:hypothetical protein
MSVKCADCGFLALLRVESGELVAADPDFRLNGNIVQTNEEWSKYIFAPYPICAAPTTHLLRLIGKCVANEREPRYSEIKKDRECSTFTEWVPGFSVKDHKEMIFTERMQAMEKERLEADRQERRERETRQDKREELDRQWREKQAEKDQEWRTTESTLATKRHRHEMWVLGFGAILVAGLTTLLAAFIERGSLFGDTTQPTATTPAEPQKIEPPTAASGKENSTNQ